MLTAANGAVSTTETGDEGWFVFEDPQPGESKLLFAPPAGAPTEVEVNIKGGRRAQVIAFLVEGDPNVSGKRKPARIDLEASAMKMLVDSPEPVEITAFIDELRQAEAKLVWVMETRTDAVLEPTGTPETVLLYAGSLAGRAEVWAELPDEKSKKVRIKIEEPK